jgi:hypothetical protein
MRKGNGAFSDYLDRTGETAASVALRVGVSTSTLTRPLNGQRNCPFTTALAVEKVTSRKVRALDFLAECLEARRAFLAERERAA